MAVIQNSKPEKFIFDLIDYSASFNGDKGLEERAIAARFMKLLNDNKFDNVDDIVKYNPNLKTFLANNKCDVLPVHFGGHIKDEDYQTIVENIKDIVKKKMVFENEKIHEVNFDNKNYVEYDGRVVDNTNSNRSMEEEFTYLQRENTDYQSFDAMNNSDQMANEVIDEKKHEVEFTDLDSVNRDSLNSEQQRLYDAALIDQYMNDTNKQISFEEGLTIDEDNNINRLSEENGKFRIENDETVEKTSISLLQDIDATSLSDTDRALYDAALNYELVTGDTIRLDLDQKLVITSDNEVKQIIKDDDGSLVVDDERMKQNDSMMSTSDMEFTTPQTQIYVKKLVEWPKKEAA